MRKNILTLMTAMILLAFQSCNKEAGIGPMITKEYSLSDFTSVYTGLDGDVYYTQGSTYKVEIHAQANIMNMIQAHIDNGELQLSYEKFKNLGRHERVSVYITAPSLNSLGINGPGSLYALQPISGTDISLKVNGSGNMSIVAYSGTSVSANISGSGYITVNGGSVNNEDLRINGSGALSMLGLQANDATTNTSGSGTMTVNAANGLHVHISGSGDVFYTGYPAVNSSISGSGRVKHI